MEKTEGDGADLVHNKEPQRNLGLKDLVDLGLRSLHMPSSGAGGRSDKWLPSGNWLVKFHKVETGFGASTTSAPIRMTSRGTCSSIWDFAAGVWLARNSSYIDQIASQPGM